MDDIKNIKDLKVLQICFGDIPLHLYSCLSSVQLWSSQNNFEYERIIDLKDFNPLSFPDSKSKFLYLRHVSDFLRTKYLSENPHTLYIDWDVFLYPDFKIPDLKSSTFARDSVIDSMFYNGEDLKVFSDIHKQIEAPSFSPKYNLSMAIRNYTRKNIVNRFEGRYLHFDNCRFSDQYLK
jgi:hypothetical protein